MRRTLRAYPVTRSRGASDTDPVRFVASTEDRLGDGYALKLEDWDLSRWKRHPVIMYGHELDRLPIGRGQAFFDDRLLMVDVTYDLDDPFARQVRSKALKGLVGASVGWKDKRDGGRTVHELIEISNVPVPLDPAALAVARSLADRHESDGDRWLREVYALFGGDDSKQTELDKDVDEMLEWLASD